MRLLAQVCGVAVALPPGRSAFTRSTVSLAPDDAGATADRRIKLAASLTNAAANRCIRG